MWHFYEFMFFTIDKSKLLIYPINDFFGKKMAFKLAISRGI